MISWSHIISESVHADLYHAYRCLDHMLVGFQCLSPLGVLADVVTKLPSLELSIVVERPTMIVGGLGPYTQVLFYCNCTLITMRS